MGTGMPRDWRQQQQARARPETYQALEESVMNQVRELKTEIEEIQAKTSADAALFGEKLLALGGGSDVRAELDAMAEETKACTAKCLEIEEKVAKVEEAKRAEAEAETKAKESAAAAAAASSDTTSSASNAGILKALEGKAEAAEVKAAKAELKVTKAALSKLEKSLAEAAEARKKEAHEGQKAISSNFEAVEKDLQNVKRRLGKILRAQSSAQEEASSSDALERHIKANVRLDIIRSRKKHEQHLKHVEKHLHDLGHAMSYKMSKRDVLSTLTQLGLIENPGRGGCKLGEERREERKRTKNPTRN